MTHRELDLFAELMERVAAVGDVELDHVVASVRDIEGYVAALALVADELATWPHPLDRRRAFVVEQFRRYRNACLRACLRLRIRATAGVN